MKRGAVIGVAVITAVILTAGGVTAWVLTRPPSPEAVAEQYLHALSEGDFPTIARLVVDGGADLEAIESAFTGATDYITDYSFELDEQTDAALSARADVELDGEPAVVGFVLVDDEGRWKVGADYLASLEVQPTIGDSVRVGGALFPAATPIALLPAVYPVTAAPEGLVEGESTVLVTNETPLTVPIDAALAPAATEQAQRQLDAYAEACAQPADEVPANCGLRVPWAADLAALESIRYRIDAYPTVSISEDASTFDAVDGQITATASGSTRDGRPGTFTYAADDWALRGGVQFTGDEMILAVR